MATWVFVHVTWSRRILDVSARPRVAKSKPIKTTMIKLIYEISIPDSRKQIAIRRLNSNQIRD